jgi:hypothetical protein
MSCALHPRFQPDCLACQAGPPDVRGGLFFGVTEAGRYVAIGPELGDAAPDVWICRRVADFPGGRVPAGGARATCDQCGAPIAFNPLRVVAAPKRCFQCCAIAPLPMEP